VAWNSSSRRTNRKHTTPLALSPPHRLLLCCGTALSQPTHPQDTEHLQNGVLGAGGAINRPTLLAKVPRAACRHQESRPAIWPWTPQWHMITAGAGDAISAPTLLRGLHRRRAGIRNPGLPSGPVAHDHCRGRGCNKRTHPLAGSSTGGVRASGTPACHLALDAAVQTGPGGRRALGYDRPPSQRNVPARRVTLILQPTLMAAAGRRGAKVNFPRTLVEASPGRRTKKESH